MPEQRVLFHRNVSPLKRTTRSSGTVPVARAFTNSHLRRAIELPRRRPCAYCWVVFGCRVVGLSSQPMTSPRDVPLSYLVLHCGSRIRSTVSQAMEKCGLFLCPCAVLKCEGSRGRYLRATYLRCASRNSYYFFKICQNRNDLDNFIQISELKFCPNPNRY